METELLSETLCSLRYTRQVNEQSPENHNSEYYKL
jgi:hypothetical protein